MIKSVQEGLERYEKALKAYVRRMNRLKRVYGNEDFMTWYSEDYEYVTGENGRLQAMEHVLGITKRDAKLFLRMVKRQLETKK